MHFIHAVNKTLSKCNDTFSCPAPNRGRNPGRKPARPLPFPLPCHVGRPPASQLPEAFSSRWLIVYTGNAASLTPRALSLGRGPEFRSLLDLDLGNHLELLSVAAEWEAGQRGCWAPWRPKGQSCGQRPGVFIALLTAWGPSLPARSFVGAREADAWGLCPGQAVLRARVGFCRNEGKGRDVEDAGPLRGLDKGLVTWSWWGWWVRKTRGHILCQRP